MESQSLLILYPYDAALILKESEAFYEGLRWLRNKMLELGGKLVFFYTKFPIIAELSHFFLFKIQNI